MPAASSASLPLFEKSCLEVLERLGGDESPTAFALRQEASELLAVLDAWKSQLPVASSRSSTITRVLDLYQRAMAYIAPKNTEPPTG